MESAHVAARNIWQFLRKAGISPQSRFIEIIGSTLPQIPKLLVNRQTHLDRLSRD